MAGQSWAGAHREEWSQEIGVEIPRLGICTLSVAVGQRAIWGQGLELCVLCVFVCVRV